MVRPGVFGPALVGFVLLTVWEAKQGRRVLRRLRSYGASHLAVAALTLPLPGRSAEPRACN